MAHKIDFVGLNTYVYDPIVSGSLFRSDSDTTSSIGYPTALSGAASREGSWPSPYKNTLFTTIPDVTELVVLNLHRNGPYGWPTFKQTRNADKRIVKYYKENSIFTYEVTNNPQDNIAIATEPSIKFNNYPLEYDLIVVKDSDDTGINVKIKVSYNNNFTFFANEQVNLDHDIVLSDMIGRGRHDDNSGRRI